MNLRTSLLRLLKKTVSVVLASLQGSTYTKEYDSPRRSLRPSGIEARLGALVAGG
jgi:hypothetical protein